MPDVFLSYASADRERVAPLAHMLEESGWTVWWDSFLLPGQNWEDHISEALTSARCVVVVWSVHSVASEWVRLEASIARDRHILAPIQIDDVRPPITFTRIQTVSFVHSEGGIASPAFATLAEGIRAILARADDAAEPAPAAEPRVLEAAVARALVVEEPAPLIALIRCSDSEGLQVILETADEYELSPEDIERKPFDLAFPVDGSNRRLPAEIVLRLNSPNFRPESQNRRLSISPARDSSVCTFLLTPLKVGRLVIQLEIYQREICLISRILRAEGIPVGSTVPVPAYRVTAMPLAVEISASPISSEPAPKPVLPEATPPRTSLIGRLGQPLAILLIALAGGLAGYSLMRAPEYRAEVLVNVGPSPESYVSNTGMEHEVLQAAAQTIKSRTAVQNASAKVAQQMGDAPIYSQDVLTKWRLKTGIFKPEPKPPSRVVAGVADQVQVKVIGSSAVSVICPAPDPRLATSFCNTLSNEFVEQRRPQSADVNRWFAAQLLDVRRKLEAEEKRVRAYAEQSAAPDNSELSLLQSRLRLAVAEQQRKRSQYSALVSATPESLSHTAADPGLREYAAKIEHLRQERQELSTSVPPTDPRLQRLDAQIAEGTRELERRRKDAIDPIHQEYVEARAREASAEASFESALRASGLTSRAATYEQLKRDVSATRQLYDALAARLQQASLSVSVPSASSVQVSPEPALPVDYDGLQWSGVLLSAAFAFSIFVRRKRRS